MNIIFKTKTLKLFGLTAITAGLVGCATPKPYGPLESLKKDYQAVSQDEVKRKSAPVTLYEVEGLIKQAEDAADIKNEGLLEHTTYLGQKKLETALAKVKKKEHETQIKMLSAQRNELLISARTKEAQTLKSEAQILKEQAAQLKQQADAAKSSLEAYKSKETSRGTVLVLDDLLFDTGGSNLHLGSQKNLDPLVAYLKENPKRNVSIGGHTDSVGEEEFNQALSLRRADAVREYLKYAGIDASRIATKGYGELYPVASNNTREGRQMNRRVEILIKN